MATIAITGDTDADRVLEDPFALLLGMLLDQQYPMEHAFRGPAKILDRFGTLDPATIAEADPEEFAALCATTPAVHRFPGSMAGRVQAVARIVATEHDGQADRLWTEAATGKELVKRIASLPGFGQQKAKILTALLAKQRGVRPEGWEDAVGDYALEGYRSSPTWSTWPRWRRCAPTRRSRRPPRRHPARDQSEIRLRHGVAGRARAARVDVPRTRAWVRPSA